MITSPAFVLHSPFLSRPPKQSLSIRTLCTPPLRTTTTKFTAVLDTPASNTYLQRYAELSVRNFLTRRAVNTVMYYMHEMRDSVTCRWLTNFDDFAHKIEHDCFLDGDAYLDRMMRARNEKGTIKVSHMRGRLSTTYKFTIEPYRIATRIFNIRKQLASEWESDLKCIKIENLEIQRMAVERLLCTTTQELESKRNLIFDHDPLSPENTPLRYKNYSALKTLTTRHAVSRLLPYMRDHASNHDYMYLLQFNRAYGPINDGDQYVNHLMSRPLEERTNPSHTIHPRSLALQILELRLTIANEWIDIMQFIPEEHILMNRHILEKSINMSTALGEDFPSSTKISNPSETASDDEEANRTP